MLIVTDDFSGLSSALSAFSPDTDHQLCLVYMQRNLRRNISKGDVKAFYEELEIIKGMNDFEKALVRFEKLCKRSKKKYLAYIKSLLSKKERYFQYLKYPEGVRKHIYTSNIVKT